MLLLLLLVLLKMLLLLLLLLVLLKMLLLLFLLGSPVKKSLVGHLSQIDPPTSIPTLQPPFRPEPPTSTPTQPSDLDSDPTHAPRQSTVNVRCSGWNFPSCALLAGSVKLLGDKAR